MSARPLQTVFWGQWQKIRWLLLTTLVGIAASYIILAIVDSRGLRPGVGEASEDFLVALLLISLPVIVTAASILLGHSDSERLQIAMPARVLMLPLATWKLVVLFLGFGALITALVALSATLPALFMLNVDFAWWLPVVAAVSAMVLLQLWAYTFGDASPRAALLSFTVCFVSVAWIARRPVLVRLITESNPAVTVMLLVLLLTLTGAIAVGVVTINRRGGWTGQIALLNPSTVRARRKRRPFSSKRTAQFWYEWRLFGSLLPVYVTAAAIVYFFGLPLVVGVFRLSDSTGNSSSEGIDALFSIGWYTSAQFVTTGIGLSALIGGIVVGGIMFMRAGHWNSQSSYLLTRPLSIQRIASARVQMMFASTALTLVLLVSALGALSALLATQGESLGLMRFLNQGYDHLHPAIPLACFWGGIVLFMWIASWSINSVWVLSILALVHLPPLAIIWSLTLLGELPLVDARSLTYPTITICNWIASGFFVLGLLWMAYRSDKRRIVHPSLTWIAAVLWLGYSAAFYYYVTEWDIPPTAQDWAVRFPNPVNWSIWIGISALPVTPLFLQPLLVENARHH